MRIALIATDEAGYEPDRQPAELGGRALILHQLDFALGQGCGKILYLGHAGGPEALALREAAERAGALSRSCAARATCPPPCAAKMSCWC